MLTYPAINPVAVRIPLPWGELPIHWYGIMYVIGFAAAWWLARYAEKLETRHAVWFGCFTAAACLTKGNGLSVVLMPIFSDIWRKSRSRWSRSSLGLAPTELADMIWALTRARVRA